MLVTGAGGGSGLSSIRILKETTGHFILGADCNKYSTGLELADEKAVVPRASSNEFVDSIKNIIKKYDIDAVLPNVDDELEVLCENRAALKQLIISPLETIQVCNDKRHTISKLENAIPVPRLYGEDKLENIVFPVIVKPRVSRGSRNIFKAETPSQLAALRTYLDTLSLTEDKRIILEYLPGDEYTVDCVFDLSGDLIIAVPRKRIATNGSVCSIGKVEHNSQLVHFVEKISKVLKFQGPINVQFRRDINGKLKILEINPRIAGAVPITLKAGVNIPNLALKIATRAQIKPSEISFNNTDVFRYLTEV